MKRKIPVLSLVLCVVIICAAALCVTLLCTAGFGGMTFQQFHKNTKYTDPAPAINSIEKVDVLANMSYKGGYGDVVLFEDSTTAKFYNPKTNQVLVQLDVNKLLNYEFLDVYGYDFFVVVEGSRNNSATSGQAANKATIYNADGVAVASSNEAWLQNLADLAQVVRYEANLIQFGSRIYHVDKKGTLSQVMDNPFFGNIPQIDYFTSKYYYEISERSVAVYDKELNCVYTWMPLTSEIDDCSITPISGDRLLIQQFYPLLDSEAEYDLIMDDSKYNIDSMIIDVKSGKSATRELDYVLVSAMSPKDALSTWDAEYTLPGRIDTYAVVAVIENNRTLDSSNALKTVSINSRTGKIEFEIFTDLQGTTSQLAEHRYLYRTYNDDRYLIDHKGKIISKINKITSTGSIKKNACYMLFDNKVYDYDLNMVYDYGKLNLDVYQMMGHSILFVDESGDMTLLTGSGELVGIPIGASVALVNNQIYALQSSDFTTYSIFTEDGTQIGSDLTVNGLSMIRKTSDVSIISTQKDETVEFYRLFFTK